MQDVFTGDIVAEGDVTILDHGHIWRGTNFIYNAKTGDVRTGTFKTVQTPFAVSGPKHDRQQQSRLFRQ